jgi:solute carrier family 25 carnitine/acylcarnitine transporter 20/29
MKSFIAGFAYGITNVVIGQPLDTIKTRMQAVPGTKGMVSTTVAIFREEGIIGLYRGGLPLVLFGGLIRSTQFGCYHATLSKIKELNFFNQRIFEVGLAGMVGGFCRGSCTFFNSFLF